MKNGSEKNDFQPGNKVILEEVAMPAHWRGCRLPEYTSNREVLWRVIMHLFRKLYEKIEDTIDYSNTYHLPLLLPAVVRN